MKKVLNIVIGILFCSNLFGQVGDSLMNEILYLFDKGDFEKSFPLVIKLAEKENREAQFYLGVFYSDEHFSAGIEQNDSLAFYWFVKSATQEYQPSILKVSDYYEKRNDINGRNQILSICAKKSEPTCLYAMLHKIGDTPDLSPFSIDTVISWTLPLLMDTSSVWEINYYKALISSLIAKQYLKNSESLKSTPNYYAWLLIYNEFKKYDFVSSQKRYVIGMNNLNSRISIENRNQAEQIALKLLGKLDNLDNLISIEEITTANRASHPASNQHFMENIFK